jgi:glycosyltransferase involved in cell wall biosynthesis
MNISIIIPTHNRRSMLRKALQSLRSQEYEGDREIIVIVDGCTDDTAGMLRSDFPEIRTVQFEKNVGAAVGLNAGANAAQGKVLLFLDDDMEYRPGLVYAHQRMHGEGRYDVVIGHFPLGNMPTPSFFRSAIHEWTEDWQRNFTDDVSFFDALCSGHFSLKRDLYQAVGGFDEKFSVWGRKDSELGHRLLLHGATFGFCRAAQAVQNYEKPPSRFLADFELLGKADVDLCAKHPQVRDALLLSVYHQAPWIVLLLRKLFFESPALASLLMQFMNDHFDRLHAAGMKGSLYEGLLWMAADARYWEGVRKKWSRPTFLREMGNPVSILMYHRIAEDASGFSVSLETFKTQMRYLEENGYIIHPLSVVADALSNKNVLPPKSVVITFDDGYADFLDAWTVLQAFKFPVTLFVPTAYVGKTNAWETQCMPNDIPMLSSPQLQKLVQEGVDIQAHSHRHGSFTKISPQEIRQEIADNLSALRQLGVQAKLFAYPSGECTPVARSLLREAGFKAALTCVSTLASHDSDLMALPRITVENGDMEDFEMRLKYGIGLRCACEELLDQVRMFRPAKYWHTAPDFDPNRIYCYQTKRPKEVPSP